MSRLLTILGCAAIFLLCVPFAFTQAQNVPDMLQQVLPAVVTVGVYTSENTQQAFGFAGKDEADIAYEHMLDISGVQSSGSGFIVELRGKKYIITNAHVVEKATGDDALAVFTINRSKYSVRIVGGDSFYDIALLEFTGAQPGDEIGVLSFKEEEPRIGETVYAIGNALGEYPYTVTNGIISAKNRMFGEGLTDKFGYLQSSAPIIWGNSGGPLIDASGKVVGINTRIGLKNVGGQSMVVSQLNFALEAKLAERLVNDFVSNNGRVRRTYLGIEAVQRLQHGSTQDTPDVTLDSLPTIHGVLPGSPAEAVLAQYIGYAISRVNDVEVRNIQELLGALEEVRPGSSVSLQLDLAGQKQTVTIQSSELTPEALSGVAQYCFQHYASLDVVETNNTVVVKSEREKQPQDLRQPQYYQYLRDMEGKRRYQRQQGAPQQIQQTTDAGVRIGSAGLIVDTDNYTLWRVKSLMSLGVAVRLSALSGVIDYMNVIREDNPTVVRIGLSSTEGEINQTLYY